jgi:hypothetical protein
MFIYNFFTPWIITVIIEFVIIWSFIREKPVKLFFYSILINSITLPLATGMYIYFFHNLLLIECLVFLVEVVLLKAVLEITYSRAIIISLLANIISLIVGLWILGIING